VVPKLGELAGLPPSVIQKAVEGAGLCKCDLVTLMVGELPELQGDMGAEYAAAQGIDPTVANSIREHYQPRGADDPTAPSDVGALLALADRFDTLVGCFAIGQVPTGTADPLALRRSTLGILRTLFDKKWDLKLESAIRAAYEGFAGTRLDAALEPTAERLGLFFKDRLRGLLPQPNDVIDACLEIAAGRPLDARHRAEALAQMQPEVQRTSPRTRVSNLCELRWMYARMFTLPSNIFTTRGYHCALSSLLRIRALTTRFRSKRSQNLRRVSIGSLRTSLSWSMTLTFETIGSA